MWIRWMLVLGLLVSAGCARKESPVDVGNRDQVLHFGNGSDPKDLDPHVVTGVPEHNIISALIEGLVSEDPKTLEPVPGTAERWDISEDGTRYTFYLRQDAQWSNGDAVTADDFVFSYKRMLSPAMGNPYAEMLFYMVGAEAYSKGELSDFAGVGVKAEDAHTLTIQLRNPTPFFLSLLNHFTWFPVHPGTIRTFKAEETVDTGWTRPESYVGNGAFVLDQWAAGDRIVVTKSPTYWDRDTVRLNAIHFHAIGDHNAEERAFRSGQLHVTGTIPMERIAHYQKNEPELLRLDPYLGCYYYIFNVNTPPLDDARVRRALALSIDRDALTKYVVKAGEAPAYHFTPPGTAGYTADAGVNYDPEAARALLAEAGYPDGKDFPALPLLYNTSDAHATIAQAIGRMWEEALGIKIQLQNMEWKVYLSHTLAKKHTIARAAWIADYVDPSTFLGMWITDGGNNRSGRSNAEYDALLRKSQETSDTAERHAIFREAEALLMREAPIAPIYFYVSKTLLHPAVRGWHPTLLDHHPYKHVYLEAPES